MPDAIHADYSVLDDDPFSTAVLADPVPFDTLLRETAPIVWLERYGVWATGRHAEVRTVFRDWDNFSSAFGTGLLNIKRAENWREPSVILDADPPEHTKARAVMGRVLSPSAIRALRQEFQAEADRMVAGLVARRHFDAATDLAQAYPLTVLPDALGMEEKGREHLLPYADLNFQAMGPRNGLYADAERAAVDAREFVARQMRRESLSPDGFGARIYAAADSGEITEHEAGMLVRTFLSAGVDTTVFGIATAIRALADNPHQWTKLSADPRLARQAFDEALRYSSPSPIIGRTTARAVELAGAQLGAEEKVLLFLGAANRDPRLWSEPDRFDLGRRTAGHVAFGVGIHGCVGQMIARLEAECVLSALARQVARIEITGEPVRKLSNWLRGYTSLPVAVTPA